MDLHDELLTLIANKKSTPNGWTSFNAPCCVHNGESRDKKKRGGIKRTDDNGVSYHCFNCGWKASWRPGRNLGSRMQDLFRWLGASDDQVRRLAFECLKIETGSKDTNSVIAVPAFEPREFPPNSQLITVDLITNKPHIVPVVEYIYSRGLTLEDRDFYWSEKYPDRFITPLTVDHKRMGYIARKCGPGNPKYITEHPAHLVFNLDRQTANRKFVLVFEGSIDAMLLDGVAVLSNEVSPEQAQQINALNRPVIVVPDRDNAGRTLINHALALGWGVAFPDWADDIKDAGDAVLKYGRLATMISIVKSVETNDLKIKLRIKL
jgi:hypothetical protein